MRKRDVRKGLVLVSKWWSGGPPSAQFVLGAVLVQQLHVRERKVAMLSFTFALPLAIHVYFGHLHHVAHLGGRKREHEEQKHVKQSKDQSLYSKIQALSR